MSPLARATKRTFRSLRIRNYKLYFFGQIVSMSGTWMQTVAQAWLVLRLTGSGVALGITTGLQFLPVLIAGAWGGVLVDRLDKRRVIIGTQIASAVMALLLWGVTATGVVELWMVYALALALGCITVIDVPARQSFVMEMVGPDDITNAVGLNTTVFTSARVVGPAIAALLISTVGLAPCFLINGLSYIAVIYGLSKMDVASLRAVERTKRAKGQLRDGLKYVWSKPELRSSLLLMSVVGTMAFNFRVLLPLLSEDVFHGGAGLYGTLSAIMGGGTVVGALIAANRARPTRKLMTASALAFGVLIVLAGAAPNIGLELAALIPLGAVSIVFVATCNATLQLNSSDAMRGRVMALYSVVFLGTTPIGGPLVGWLAEAFGPRMAFYVAGGSTALGALAAYGGLARIRWQAAAAQGVPEEATDPAQAA